MGTVGRKGLQTAGGGVKFQGWGAEGQLTLWKGAVAAPAQGGAGSWRAGSLQAEQLGRASHLPPIPPCILTKGWGPEATLRLSNHS